MEEELTEEMMVRLKECQKYLRKLFQDRPFLAEEKYGLAYVLVGVGMTISKIENRSLEDEDDDEDTGWWLSIDKIGNGFLLTSSSDEFSPIAIVEEEIRYPMDEAERTARLSQKLLYEVLEYFCLYGSKHDSVRVKVILENQGNRDCNGCITKQKADDPNYDTSNCNGCKETTTILHNWKPGENHQ